MKRTIIRTIAGLAAAAVVTAFTTAAFAQDESAAPGPAQNVQHSQVAEGLSEGGAKSAGFSSILYNSSNGLPTSEANTVFQTSDGFVWIGSYSGLIRYDSNNFYRFDSSYGISSVVSLYEDTRGRLWIGTNDAGVVFLEKGEFTSYFRVGGLKTSSIHSISEDISGNILIATNLGIAYIDEANDLHLLDEPQLNTKDVSELRRAPDGVVYGRTDDGMIFTVENMKVTSFYNTDNIDIGDINSICPDVSQEGWAYLGTINSDVVHINMKDMNSFSVTDAAPLVNINRITDFDGMIWVCADNGIGVIGRDGKFSQLENIPMNNSIDDMMCDYEGNLWFASSRQGVMKISPCDFMDISLAAGLDKMVVNTTCLHGGDLYIGTDTGLHVLDSKNYREKSNEISELLKDARVRCIKDDSKGNMWLSTYSGLFCLKNGGEIVSYTADNGLDTNKVRVSEEMSDGRIVFSTSKGVYIIKDFEIVDHISSDNGLSGGDILTVCEGDNGEILFGSDGGGLYILSNGVIQRKNTDDGLRSEVIMRIKRDPVGGSYWLITSNSIAYMQGGEIHTVDNFPYSNNFDIFFDGEGGAWILSSNGIYVTTTAALTGDRDIEYTFYDTSCGLPSVCTANSRSCVDGEGNIYISGSSGVSRVNIHTTEDAEGDVRLTIPFIEVDNGSGAETITLDGSGTVTLPSSNRRITIYAYALTYSLKNPRLSYTLRGFDNESFYSQKQEMQPVIYTNLDGGTYVFDLSVVNTLTGAVDNTVSLTIKKELAFYEEFWFKIAVILGAGVLFFLLFEIIHRRREAALIREQERKQQLIDEMIQAFAKCVDMKDKYTNGHSFRVAEYSKLLAEKMGKSEIEMRDVYNVALLHDIGKISIPDSVLNKPGRPTDEEYEILKTHAANGYEVLRNITIAPDLAYGAGYHHERLDGKGYPNGLKGDEIPEVAQIIAVADTFDAMYSTRPYRKQMDVNVVLEELKRVSGTQLNGDIVNCLVELVEEGKIGQRKL